MNCFQSAHNDFEELIYILRSEGHDQVAQTLHMLLHEVAWTEGSELMGELGVEILTFQRTVQSLSLELQKSLRCCMEVVKRVWPDIEKVSRTRE